MIYCPRCDAPAKLLPPDILTGKQSLACDGYDNCGWVEGDDPWTLSIEHDGDCPFEDQVDPKLCFCACTTYRTEHVAVLAVRAAQNSRFIQFAIAMRRRVDLANAMRRKLGLREMPLPTAASVIVG